MMNLYDRLALSCAGGRVLNGGELMKNIIVGMTGESGAIYGKRLVECLLKEGLNVHLVITGQGADYIERELQTIVDLVDFNVEDFLGKSYKNLHSYHYKNHAAPLSSGFFPIDAMVIAPCSMSVLGAIASGFSTNLVSQAAAVTMKEQRKLILIPLETPYSTVGLENMLRLSRAGVCILPASPGFCYQPLGLEEMVDFVVSRILDQLGIKNDLISSDKL